MDTGQRRDPGVGLTRLPHNLTSCVTLRSELNLSEPRFPHLQDPEGTKPAPFPEAAMRSEACVQAEDGGACA